MAAEKSSNGGQVARDVVMSILALASVGIGLTLLSETAYARFGWLEAIDFVIVAIFWFDFIREIRRADNVRGYLVSHWWELPSLIPTISALVAMFPGFALLRVVRVLRLFRVVGVIMRLRPAGSYLVRLAREARLGAIFGMGAFVVFLGTLLAYAVESRVNPSMESWGQATWFALNMVTNVAYLDFQPVTMGGRILAGVLQVCGIAFIGIFTASLAGAIIRDEPERE
jgi:voltage-gated potassium channel